MRDTPIEDVVNNKLQVVVDSCILLDYLRAKINSNPSEDELIVKSTLPKFGGLLITPHVLAEISNLGASKNRNFFELVKGYLEPLIETHISKEDILKHPAFVKFGVCDAGIVIHSLNGRHCLLSKDGPLSAYAKSKGIKVISMGELRAFYLNYAR